MADSTTRIVVYETFKLGDWKLQSGEVIPNAILAYKTFGSPSSPAIIYPTWFSGGVHDNLWLVGDDKTLNPEKVIPHVFYFIIIPSLFGSGQSSSPSNCSSLRPFPKVSLYDNVRAQHKLMTEHLGVKHARAILGWSMGAAQTFQWITQYPDFADFAIPFCGAARCSVHNQVFLEGAKAALVAPLGHVSAGSKEDTVSASTKKPAVRQWTPEAKEVGLKAFGRVYAGWGFSQPFYRAHLHTKPPYSAPNIESFMQSFWETWALSKQPENLLTMLQTWQSADVGLQPGYSSFEDAMKGIKTKTLVLPSRTDLYFPPEDSEVEVAAMREDMGEMRVFESIWGHWAGGPGDSAEDLKWLDRQLREFIEGGDGGGEKGESLDMGSLKKEL